MRLHILLICYILLDILILQPIKILLTLLVRCLWRPKVSEDLFKARGLKKYPIDREREVLEFDPKFAVDDADGFKFLAILAGNLCRVPWAQAKYQELKALLLSYIDADGKIGRHPVGHPERGLCPNFSGGDMGSGLLYWLAVEATFGKGFYPEDREKISKMFLSTTFTWKDFAGNRKWPLMFENVAGTGYDRGSVYSLLSLSQEPIRLLLWFKLARIYTGRTSFWWYHKVCSILYSPILLVNPGDSCIFIGRLKVISWFPHHSAAYSSAGYIILTGSRRAKRALRSILERYPWNSGLYALWVSLFMNEKKAVPTPRRDLFPDVATIRDYADGILFKGTEAFNGQTCKYLDVKSFEIDTESTSYCPPEMLGHKFLSENNPLKPKVCSDERRLLTKIDWACAATHLMCAGEPN